jgi:hypothetical protein
MWSFGEAEGFERTSFYCSAARNALLDERQKKKRIRRSQGS